MLTATRTKNEFNVVPANQNSAKLFVRHRHALVGISPFNSRFSEDYLQRLSGWALGEFDEVDILLPGDEAALQLEAVGITSGKARYRARHAVRRNQQAAEAALEALPAQSRRVTIYRISDFTDDRAYRARRNLADQAFQCDTAFRRACLDMSTVACEPCTARALRP